MSRYSSSILYNLLTFCTFNAFVILVLLYYKQLFYYSKYSFNSNRPYVSMYQLVVQSVKK